MERRLSALNNWSQQKTYMERRSYNHFKCSSSSWQLPRHWIQHRTIAKATFFAAPEVRPDLILHFGRQWVGPQSPPVDMMCCWHHRCFLQQEQSTRAHLTHCHIAIIQSAITRNAIPWMKGKTVFCVWPGAQELWNTGAHLCDTNPPSVTDAHSDSAYVPHHTDR